MIQLSPTQLAGLRPWFQPERPGPLSGLHVINTGYGAAFADRWPAPRAILVDAAANYQLRGAAGALDSADLNSHIQGFVEADEAFVPLLKAAFADFHVWERVILECRSLPEFELPAGAVVRQLEPAEAYHLWGLSPALNWLTRTWGSPEQAIAGGTVWGAFTGDRLASAAVSFFVGDRYEDLGVVTEPEFRNRGLNTACAGELLRDILRRGKWGSWSTSPDNFASLRVAEKLGFKIERHDRLIVVGRGLPEG